MSNEIFDLIIVGAGPAGLTAGIYASRRKLNNLIISSNIGGQAAWVSAVENYPGLEEISGFELTARMKKQAEKFGSKFVSQQVVKIARQGDLLEVEDAGGEKYRSVAVLLAYGLVPRRLDVPGEKEYLNKGVAYCANCDGPLYKNKIVAVVGGGNAALDAAEYLSQLASKVYLIHRRLEFRADEVFVEKIKNTGNIELVLNSEAAEVKGEKFVKAIVVKNIEDNKIREIAVDGIFVEIGHIVDPAPAKGVVETDANNQIVVDNFGRTSAEGIFSAGDVTNGEYKQIVIAAGEGAKAALSAYKYIQLNRAAKK